MEIGTGGRTETQGGYGGESAPNLENLLFRTAETAAAVQCIFAGQLTGPMTISPTSVTKRKSLKAFATQNL